MDWFVEQERYTYGFSWVVTERDVGPVAMIPTGGTMDHANIIAAAPDMLEALERITAAYKEANEIEGFCVENCEDHKAALAAIAKAKGITPPPE